MGCFGNSTCLKLTLINDDIKKVGAFLLFYWKGTFFILFTLTAGESNP